MPQTCEKGIAMPEQRLVDLLGWRRMGRSPRKVLAALRQAYAADFTAAQGVYRNARRQARFDRKQASA